MNQQYIKIVGITVSVLLVLYIFFPLNAKQVSNSVSPGQASAVSAKQGDSVKQADKPAQAASGQTQAKTTKQNSSKKSSTQSKSTMQKIEPEQKLRKAESKTRSGPPSKMYGGL